ncbi:tyrosine protein phosphatase [Gemella sp. GH3]|uniref:CpsB/CapC family capsule biosynthesis tyrosine phosphatase n=1 Tax=unclassified Gemella TaxID=2624949 RepID=UPI0015CF8721|nr:MULTISPECIES: CpsB/CapC family capsule biosynthesis tyrosine phosphatase [unclassified Gemella]MBF0713330.1 tyrosine protein phosphatase [Gemella sp. GH3.1]NYS50282.1 tyrosine protein phosphatase [Gemella sp. GH3]
MIDIHSHIIFGVDDGPKTLEESILLIKESYSQGTRSIIATSHRRKGMFETPEEKIRENFNIIKSEIEKILPDLNLYYGAEIYFTSDILNKLENNIFPTLGDTDYVLIEFSSSTRYTEIYKAVDKIILLGKIPILAHIERYNELVNSEKKVRNLIDKGAYIQINSASVLKVKLFGDSQKEYKKRAKYFLDKDLVHFVATDMHNLTSRKPYFKEAYKIIEKKYGKKRAEDLFVNNQRKIQNNELI